MAQKPAVHIEPRDGEWTVIREGNQRATSTHSTQSEAAEIGRDLARRDETEFFLHGQEGQIREHRDYREGQTPADEGLVDPVLGTVGTVAGAADGITGTAAEVLGAGHTGRERVTETTEDPETGVLGEERGSTEEAREEPVVTPEERYADYGIYDRDGEQIGPLHDLFVDEDDEPEYIGVGTGLPANRTILVPAEVVVFDDPLRRIVVSRPRSVVETAPSLGYEDEITGELERRVRLHYGLDMPPDAAQRAGFGGIVEPPEVVSADPAPGSPGREEDEVRVRRSEEELRVGRREREAGMMRVRKRVRIDRERIEVPRKRTEVTVERVPVEGATPVGEGISATPEIAEEEIVVPIVEEEIVVEKRPVVKEEIRIRKRVVEDIEVVEEDVRKEEVEIDDETHRDTNI